MEFRRKALRPVLAVGLGMGLAASLAAGEGDPGFKWLGLRTGTLFFDSPENAGSAVLLGAQGGMVFQGQHHGFSFEGFQYKSENSLLPGVKLRHRGVSATFLSGLSDDPASSMWPYLGLGLGALSVPEVDPLTRTQTSTRATAAHVSLGFIQRHGDMFIWGLEGRLISRPPLKTLQEIQASFLLGFTWGGPSTASSADRSMPPREAVAPPPVAPPVVTAPPPAPRPSVKNPVAPTALARPMVSPTPTTVPTSTPIPATPAPLAPVILPTAPPVAQPAPAIPAPAPAKSALSVSTAAGLVEALRRGDIPRALELSRKHIEGIPTGHWTLRLEVARLTLTLKNAAWAFPGVPDLFIAPIQLRGGMTANQLFLGDYSSKEEAERGTKAVPTYFLKGRQRPIPFQVSDIPAQICPMARPVPSPAPASTPAPKGILVRPRPSCTRCH